MIRASCSGLAALLAVALVAPAARAAEPDKLLPADADSVLSVNIRQILDSDLIKTYALEQLRQALQGADAKKFLNDLGLDPLKDVERLVVAGSGKDRTDMKVLLIVRGKFDPKKLYDAAEVQTRRDPDHFSLVKDGKDTMFKLQPDNGEPWYATVVDEGTVVVANNKKSVGIALAASAEAKKPAISRDLSALITRMDDKASFWMAAVVKGKLDNAKLPGPAGGDPNLQALLGKMDTVTMVLRITADVSFDLTIGMKDEDAATEMGGKVDEMIQAIRGFLPLIAAKQPELQPLVEAARSLKSNVKDKSVVVSGRVTKAAIDKMVKPRD